jgi:putative nucleotidyltransferase with HDIG domain
MDKTANHAEILRSVQQVPLLSASASRLLQITANPDHDLADVINVLKCDSALTARLLKVVNSAAFGLLNPIYSIDRALAYLGERIVVGIAIEESAGQLFEKKLQGYESQSGDLWRHNLLTAIASREVARLTDSELNPDLTFTGGILHDIGKAIVSDFLTGTSKKLLDCIDRQEVADYLTGEKEVLGIDHTRAGYELAKYWHLPEPLQMVILHHHYPAAAPKNFQPLVYAVHLGDIIAMMCGSGTGADSLCYQLDPNYTRYFDLSSDDLSRIMLQAEEEFHKIEDSILDKKETWG